MAKRKCPTCHGDVRWVDDSWICTKCGDEFHTLSIPSKKEPK